jgi:hypothetical protein
MQCICTWILSFSYEFLYNEFASQFLQQNMCMHKLKMCIVWSGFHLSTQEMVCTKNLFFSNYFGKSKNQLIVNLLFWALALADGQH